MPFHHEDHPSFPMLTLLLLKCHFLPRLSQLLFHFCHCCRICSRRWVIVIGRSVGHNFPYLPSSSFAIACFVVGWMVGWLAWLVGSYGVAMEARSSSVVRLGLVAWWSSPRPSPRLSMIHPPPSPPPFSYSASALPSTTPPPVWAGEVPTKGRCVVAHGKGWLFPGAVSEWVSEHLIIKNRL